MQKYHSETQALVQLALPVFITQFSQVAVNYADSVMAAEVSVTDLSAVGTASLIWLPIILLGQGVLQALTPIIGQLNGANQQHLIKHHVWQGFWLALLISLPLIGLLCCTSWFLPFIPNMSTELAELTQRYLSVMIYGVPSYLLYLVLRCLCEGLSKPIPPMGIGLIGLVINIIANYIFIHGKFGAPALGSVGCAVATVIIYWLLFLFLLGYMVKKGQQQTWQLLPYWEAPNLVALSKLLCLGLPIGFSYFFEVTLFTVAPLFMIVPLGKQWIAGHQVAMAFSSVVFTLPFSIAIASSIRVSHCLGEQLPQKAKTAAYAGLVLGLCIAIATAILTMVFRDSIAAFRISDPTVITIAGQLLLFSAVYQCFDALQVVANGILRGYKDTLAAFVMTLISYWILGLSSCYILGLTDYWVPKMGANGIWCGFIIGITSAAILLLLRLVWIQRITLLSSKKTVGLTREST
ncbi:MAG: MATE family efflux transporter [Candidatus Symbiodolus clandestinus]